MALNSINTNIAALAAQGNIGRASTMAGSSIARLSSGNRIVRSSDDVAALSAGTSLRTNVTTLKMALINTSQGSSLLQVADGALAQVTDILQRQKAIAVQAGSGSLTSSERSFLNQEFQNLAQEIDRLATQTNFNGVSLLDGALFEKTVLNSANQAAGKGELTLNFTAVVADGALLQFGDVVFEVEDTGVALTGIAATSDAAINIDLVANTTIADQVSAIASALNNSSLINFSARAVGNALVLTDRTGGAAAGGIAYDTTNSTATTVQVGRTYTDAAGVALATTAVTGFSGGADLGLARGDTKAVGVMGDSVLAAQRQLYVSESMNFATATFATTNTITFSDGDTGAAGNVTFVFIDTEDAAAVAPAAGEIGIEIKEYINAVADGGDVAAARKLIVDRIVEGINNFKTLARVAGGGIVGNANAPATFDNSATNLDADYFFSRVQARRDGDTLTITATQAGAIRTVNGTAPLQAFATTVTGAIATTPGTFDINGTTILFNSGANVNGINNEAFTGTIKDFKADFRSNNVVDLSVKVGDRTYRAASVDLSLNYGVNTSVNPPTIAPNTLRLTSAEGDFFTIDLQGSTEGLSVNNQSQANLLGARLDRAFSTLNFVQNREIASYTAAGDVFADGVKTGSLTGSEFNLQKSDFSDVAIQDIRVKAPASGSQNASIEFDINGSTYRADVPFGNQIGAGGIVRLASLDNGNDVLTFKNGNTTLLLGTDGQALSFENALKGAFGVGSGGEKLKFQVGVTTEDTLQIGFGAVTTNKVYGGITLDVLTADSAALAADTLDAAIDVVTSVRAEVGALQSRFNFAAANVESSIANQDAARGVLLDTDIASESTAFATAQVQLQAGISVLAQANLLPQNLLKLIG